jgi:glucose-6-phosphate-specific signal transduction histidine kinase
MVRLRAELREQLVEVRDSRRRIVEATEVERRRIERDLHDGTQQRLVSVGLALRHLSTNWARQPGDDGILGAAVGEVTGAIEELREIARGIRPGVLDDGLTSALRDLAHRTQMPWRAPYRIDASPRRSRLRRTSSRVRPSPTRPSTRVPPASSVTCGIDGQLGSGVCDDGIGGAELRDGGGLVGVSDRVAAHGGG